MRWDALRLDDEQVAAATGGPVPLLPRGAVSRTFDTPEFQGMTFHEVTARSALNKVPDASRMPFRWTINPYRGCSMGCTYCLGEDTLVLMADGRSRPISEVGAGDRVYGTTLVGGQLPTTSRPRCSIRGESVRRAVRVTMENGTYDRSPATIASCRTEAGSSVSPGACGSADERPSLTDDNRLMGPERRFGDGQVLSLIGSAVSVRAPP